jgi:hypothetical protein
MADDKKLSGADVADRAMPVATSLLSQAVKTAPDLLTAIVALECARRTIMFVGRQQFGDTFTAQAKMLMDGFDGSDEAMAAMLSGANTFMQPGGES